MKNPRLSRELQLRRYAANLEIWTINFLNQIERVKYELLDTRQLKFMTEEDLAAITITSEYMDRCSHDLFRLLLEDENVPNFKTEAAELIQKFNDSMHKVQSHIPHLHPLHMHLDQCFAQAATIRSFILLNTADDE